MAAPGPPGSGSTSTPGVQSFGVASHDWRVIDLAHDGYGEPALASLGATVALAWQGSALDSGLLGSGAPREVATHAASGLAPDFDVALAPGDLRATAWADSHGVHLQTVAGSAAGPDVLLAADAADRVTVTQAGGGAWWVVWRTTGRLLARRVAAGGTLDPVRDLGPASATKGAHTPFLDPAGGRGWTAVPDGSGGVWVGLPRSLLRLTPAGVSTVASSRRPVALAESGGSAAVASRGPRGAMTVRVFAGSSRRTTLVRGRGAPTDAAIDRATGATYLLSNSTDGQVWLTRIARSGAGRSRLLRFCRGRRQGQVEASGGLVAIACAGHYSERDNVNTGGDSLYGRDDRYFLLRAGRVVRSQSYFEGDESY
jgi:hypothetical protein